MLDGGQVQRHGKEPAIVEDKFPKGMRVLAIDENPVCLRVLDVLLRVCQFNPTVVMDAKTALRILREGKAEQFDLVITEMHMSDMDDFKLLELILLEMDLPVIMLSVDGDKGTMLKGINHGACDCLVKPVRLKEPKYIWKHVIRKRLTVVNHNNSNSDGVDQRVQPVIVEGNQGGTKSIKCSNKNKNDGDDSYENKDRTSVATQKKKRVTWTSELHRRFMEVINRLGIDNAVPRKILQMMNVDYLTRESVASHLQKYRLYLKRVTNNPRQSNPLGDSFEKRNLSNYVNMNHHRNSSSYRKHQRGLSSSTIGFVGLNNSYIAPSMLRAQGASMQSINWKMGTFGHGFDMIRRHYLGPPVRSFTKVTYNTMLDTFPPKHYNKAYANFLREKLLEASNVVPSSHTNNFFPNTPNVGLLNPVNQFQVQPPELVTQFSAPTNATSSAFNGRQVAQIPNHVGSSSNPRHKNMVPSSFPGHIDRTPLAQSQVNVPQINQLSIFRASPVQMSMFENEYQNQMAGTINNNTSRGDFSEQTTPLFNMESNTGSIEVSSDNFVPMNLMVNGGSTNAPLPHIPIGNSVVSPTQMVNNRSIIPALNDLQESFVLPTQILNPGNTFGVHPVQEEPSDEQALNDQPNYSDPLFSDDIFTDMLNQDFNEDDTFFGGEW